MTAIIGDLILVQNITPVFLKEDFILATQNITQFYFITSEEFISV